MIDTPPPRRTRRLSAGERSFPLIPILIGVIVLGLAFGAGLSTLMQRNGNSPAALVTAAPLAGTAPIAVPIGTPSAVKGFVLPPHEMLNVPKRVPPTRAPLSFPAGLATPSEAPVRVARATPAARSNAMPVPIVTAVRTPPEPAATSPNSRRPLAVATIPPYATTAAPPPISSAPRPLPLTPKPPPASVPVQPTDEADSDFARLGAGVVRFYLNALARGDDAAARTVLDGPRGSPALRISEKEFADSSLRIVKLDAHGISDSATVNVDLSTAKGPYFEQFSLRRLPTGAAVIIEHTFIRP